MLESEYPYWWPLIEQFHRENPRIRIQLSPQKTTDDIEAIYKDDLNNLKSSYDLVYMDVIWLPKFAASEWLLDISKEYRDDKEYRDGEKGLDQFLEQFLAREVELGRYGEDKQLYRIPFRSDVGVLFYRKDWIDQAPKTFDDLQTIYQDLHNKKQVPWGYFWQGYTYEGLVTTFCEVLSAFNGFWIDPKTNKVRLGEQEAINAVNYLRSMIVKHVSPQKVSTFTEESSFADFQKDQAVFLRNWPNFWARANANGSPIKGKVAMAQIVGKDNNGAGCLGGWGFGIAKNGQHPNEAWQAIKFFTSEEAQRKFVLASSYLPSRENLFTDKTIIEKYPYFKDINMLELVKNAIPRPRIENYDEASKILQKYLGSALFIDRDPQETMKKAAEETRNLLNNKTTTSFPLKD